MEVEENRMVKGKMRRKGKFLLTIGIFTIIIISYFGYSCYAAWQAEDNAKTQLQWEQHQKELKERDARWSLYLTRLYNATIPFFVNMTLASIQYPTTPDKIVYLHVDSISYPSIDYMENQSQIKAFIELMNERNVSVCSWTSRFPYWVYGTGVTAMPEKDGYFLWFYFPSYIFASDGFTYSLMFDGYTWDNI